jgi:hypothetical protein
MRTAILLFASAALAAAQVKIAPGPEKIAVEIGGKPFGDFYVAGKDITKPYLWPLRAASGTYVTRAFPMEKAADETGFPVDHLHQRGMWMAHEVVTPASTGIKMDFWNNDPSYATTPRKGAEKDTLGVMKLKKPVEVKSGANQGTITAVFDWVDMKGERPPVLTENRVMTFYQDPAMRIVDVDATLTALEKVTFGDSKDGFFGIRMRPVLQEDKGTGRIRNADGLVTEKELWGKPSKWADYSGEVAGEKVGLAILDHPSNPHHPVRWHARAYGLFAANPFGLAVFTNDKSQSGAVTLEKGQSLRFRYRVVIHPGDAATAKIEEAWTKFAAMK